MEGGWFCRHSASCRCRCPRCLRLRQSNQVGSQGQIHNGWRWHCSSYDGPKNGPLRRPRRCSVDEALCGWGRPYQGFWVNYWSYRAVANRCWSVPRSGWYVQLHNFCADCQHRNCFACCYIEGWGWWSSIDCLGCPSRRRMQRPLPSPNQNDCQHWSVLDCVGDWQHDGLSIGTRIQERGVRRRYGSRL